MKYRYLANSAQAWNVVYDDKTGTYSFTPDCAPSSALYVNGTNATIYINSGLDAQRFTIKEIGDGSYNILATKTGGLKGLTNLSSSTSNDTNVGISTVTGYGSDNQRWYFEKADDPVSDTPTVNDTYYIRSRLTGQYLDVYCGGQTNGTQVIQYYRSSGKHQQFKLENAGSGYYYLVPQHTTGLVLSTEPAQSGIDLGISSQISIRTRNGSDLKQKFAFYTQSNGTYRIAPASNISNALDVYCGKFDNSTPIVSATYLTSNNQHQQWILEKVS